MYYAAGAAVALGGLACAYLSGRALPLAARGGAAEAQSARVLHMGQRAPVPHMRLPAGCTGQPVHGLKESDVSFLADNGVTIKALSPLGAEVRGIDLRQKPSEPVLAVLESAMATRGFLVFKDQGVLSGDEQVEASEYWGARQMHSTHGVHPKAPNSHIFRLANERSVGILGVGPQWHNDGSFERAVFSHVGYHIVRVAEGGGGTIFAHQGGAFDALPLAERERWQRLISVNSNSRVQLRSPPSSRAQAPDLLLTCLLATYVLLTCLLAYLLTCSLAYLLQVNSNSGVLHPVVHEHPISGRKSVYLHLGMTGAVIEVLPEADSETSAEGKPIGTSIGEPTGEPGAGRRMRLLDEDEMRHLFQTYNALLNAGFAAPSRADMLGAAPRYGSAVRLRGFDDTADLAMLNGKRGIVSGVLDRANGRVAVDVELRDVELREDVVRAETPAETDGGPPTSTRLLLEPANLEPISANLVEAEPSGVAAAAAGAGEMAYTAVYEYEAGDCIFIDNLAVAHRATPEARLLACSPGANPSS